MEEILGKIAEVLPFTVLLVIELALFMGYLEQAEEINETGAAMNKGGLLADF